MTSPQPDRVRQPRPGRRKRRIIRVAVWTVAGLLLLPVLAWLAAAVYIQTHKKEVLATVLERLNENIDGSLIVESMEPEMFADFPNASIALRGVSLRDSLYPVHRRALFGAKKIFVRVSPLSAVSGSLIIRQVQIQDGRLHLFTDSNEYSNAYLLAAKDTTDRERREGPDIKNVVLKNVAVLIENAPKSKRFALTVQEMEMHLEDVNRVEKIEMDGRMKVGGLAFNTARGAFLAGKVLDLPLDVTFDKNDRTLDIPEQKIRVDGHPLFLTANFRFSGDTPPFRIRVRAEEMLFTDAVSMLSENISSKLAVVQLKEPAALEADIQGRMKFRDTPVVHVKFRTEDNMLSVPGAQLTDCSFAGYFYNVFRPGRGHGDPNSIVALHNLRATFEGIPFTVDTAAVRNLKQPLLYARIRSQFPAERLNNITGGRPFRFRRGNADFNVEYAGSLSLTDTVVPSINGAVNIRNAEMVYTPRGLPLSGVDAQLQFAGATVRFPRVAFRTGRSAVTMRGEAQNALLALHRPQYPASLRWDVQSPGIFLGDFLPFLSQRGGGSAATNTQKKNGSQSPLADRIDDMLDRADAHVTAAVSAVEYEAFRAEAVRADVTLTRTHAHIRNASLRHAGGTVQVSGEAEQGAGGGPFRMKAAVRDVNVNSLFTTFENFGQDALTAKNIRGIVSFDADLAGRLAAGARVQPASLKGHLNFNVRKGALMEFGPLEKVGRYIFRKRNLSDLRFEVLKARFNLADERIEIEPMEVRSSALSLNLVGVYGMKKGTDISFQVPLRNPKKDSADLAREADFEAGDRGIVIHLRAQNPTGQKLDIDWDRGGKLYKRRLGGEALEPAAKDDDKAEQKTDRPSRKKRRQARREARGE